jgi:hypothetical protein
MAIYRCRIRGHSATILDWSFGFHVSAVTGVASALSSAVADGFNDFWDGVPSGTDAVKTLYDIATLADDVLVDELDSANVHNVAQAITTLTLAGTGTGGPLPPQTAVVISKVSSLPSRRGRGRMYLPPPTVDTDDSGRLDSGARDIIAVAAKNMFTTISTAAGGAYDPVIVHPDFIPSAFTPFLQVKVGDVFDTQRNRRNKLKEAFNIQSF